MARVTIGRTRLAGIELWVNFDDATGEIRWVEVITREDLPATVTVYHPTRDPVTLTTSSLKGSKQRIRAPRNTYFLSGGSRDDPGTPGNFRVEIG